MDGMHSLKSMVFQITFLGSTKSSDLKIELPGHVASMLPEER